MGRRAFALILLTVACGRTQVYQPRKVVPPPPPPILDPCATLGTSRPCTTLCGPGTERCVNGGWSACSSPEPLQPPATLSLVGTIRDFHEAHPDFEKGVGDDRGLVKVDLGADHTPIYAHAGKTQSVSSPQSFAQWYHDVPGVNLGMPLGLVLERTSQTPLVYSFVDNDFFPIDNKLFGNEGHNHNFHFTLELHTEVEYRGGETLAFQGDDDLIVFINDRLAIDLGGAHPTEKASISLDGLGLTAGTAYPLDIFFAERHTSSSTLRIETTNAHFAECP